MTLDTSNETEAAITQETITISEPNLSFTDYERVRRGESVPKVASVTKSAPGEKSPEQKSAPESETEETEESKENENEAEGEESEEKDAESKDGATDKPKKKGGFARRIDKLTQQKAQLQSRVEQLEQMALKNAGAPKTDTQAEAAKTEAASGKPKADDFDTHAEFVEALTDWKVEQKEKAREEKSQKSKLEDDHKTRVQKYVTRREALQAKTPDFDEVMEDVEGVRLSPIIESLLLESENGPELAYELAKQKDELTRICKLPPAAAAREFGKFESKLSQASSAEKKPEAKQITKAPKPLEPVKANGKAAVKKSIGDPGISYAEFEKLRREQMKRK